MLYNLLVPWASEWTALNVFRYITFRSMAALITALVLSILLGPRFIAWLRRLKCGQHILHEVTAHACKEGTPTMGGLLMLFSLTVSLLLWADLGNFYIWQTLLVFWGFAAVAWFKVAFPPIERQIERIPRTFGKVVTWALCVFMAVNMIVSAMALVRYNARIEGEPAHNQVEVYLDAHFDDARMQKIYPKAVHTG